MGQGLASEISYDEAKVSRTHIDSHQLSKAWVQFEKYPASATGGWGESSLYHESPVLSLTDDSPDVALRRPRLPGYFDARYGPASADQLKYIANVIGAHAKPPMRASPVRAWVRSRPS